MELPEISNTEIATIFNKELIVEDLINQIKKDLGMFGIDFLLPQDAIITYSELLKSLVSNIEPLFKEDKNRLFSILYRVDISEKDLESAGKELPDYNQIEIVAHQIIKRELKKVLIRKYYKQT
jgi:hypothetical protein